MELLRFVVDERTAKGRTELLQRRRLQHGADAFGRGLGLKVGGGDFDGGPECWRPREHGVAHEEAHVAAVDAGLRLRGRQYLGELRQPGRLKRKV